MVTDRNLHLILAKRLNEWFTDSHGFRNRDYFDDKKYDVVITVIQ